MKKLLKLFGLLLAMGTLFCLSGCDLATLLGEDNTQQTPRDNEEKAKTYEEVTSGDKIEHEFYLSLDQPKSNKYFTSTTAFTYTTSKGVVYDETNPCIYQFCFHPTISAETKGTWTLYTRPKASTSTIELIYKGTYEGKVTDNGQVKLFIDNNLIQTLDVKKKVIQLENTSPDTYVFTANMTAAHKSIGAKDAK